MSMAVEHSQQAGPRYCRILLRVGAQSALKWHSFLADSLRRIPGVSVEIEWSSAGGDLPSPLRLLFSLEAAVNRVPNHGHLAPLRPDRAERRTGAPSEFSANADLTIDFAGDAGVADHPVWRVSFDGEGDPAAAAAALIDGRTPRVAILDARTGQEVASGHPGSDRTHVVLLALQDILIRTASLIVGAAKSGAIHVPPSSVHSAPAGAGRIGRYAAKKLIRNVVARLYHLCFYSPHWKVGWRYVDGPDVFDLRAHPASGWNVLPSPADHFYADPFPFEHEGRLWLFVEDWDHHVGRAHISVVEFGPDGPIGRPRPVLQTGQHFSYPVVLKHEGQVFMMPECSGSKAVDVYRAERFPDVWVPHARLIDDEVVSDATIVGSLGRLWMFGTVQDRGGSYSDDLHLWSAESLFGEWKPHPLNPVLIDIGSARPAGHMVWRNGAILRPVQDCTRTYGGSLGIARVTKLDDEGYAQVVETTLGADAHLWPGSRLHTLNRAGRLECIDGSAKSPRFGPARRGAEKA